MPCHQDGLPAQPARAGAGSDNSAAFALVAPGDGVVWTYRDNACDLAACAGHDIRIEDGTPGGRSLGFMRHAAGEQQIRWKIPADAQPESIIRYLCLAHADLGMTGAFQILPIGLGTITYPTLPGH